MKDFNYTDYRKNNPLLKESSGQNDLTDYVKSAAEKCFQGGGNGQNLLDNAQELSSFIDVYMETAHRMGPEEGGFYTASTAIAFKKLIDSMVKDEITNNNASKYGGGDDEDSYDQFTDTINNIK